MWSEIAKGVVTLALGAALLLLGDRFYPVLHRGQRKYEAKERMPRIRAGKLKDLNIDGTEIFTMHIEEEIKVCDGKDELFLYPKFTAACQSTEKYGEYEYGLRIVNNTNDDMVLKRIYIKSGDELDLTKTSWKARFIEPNTTLVLRYGARDCPKLIMATYKQYLFKYEMDLNSECVEPDFAKKEKGGK